MRTLVIVDMQKGAGLSRYHGNYLNSKWWQRHAETVARISKLAASCDRTIFITDTRFRKAEHFEIVEPLAALFRQCLRLWKSQDDGIEQLRDHLGTHEEVLVCGMNTDACVLRTARSLHRLGLRVKVVGDCCWTAYAVRRDEHGRWRICSRAHSEALWRMRVVHGMQVLTSGSEVLPK